MYDKDLTNKWHVEIEFFEDDVHTHASAHARLRDDTIATTGDAYRNPKDPSAPMIGEEIAAARALIALGTDLLVAASANIEQSTKRPAHLYR
ncbi:dsRBD fold-containing protein [Mycolicibacterium sp. HS_4_1]